MAQYKTEDDELFDIYEDAPEFDKPQDDNGIQDEVQL